MISKNKLKIIIAIIIVVVFYGAYKFSSFSLFDEDKNITSIETIILTDKPYNIKIYYIPSNAVTQSNIQIRRVHDESEETLQVYERYNFLENYEVKNDSLFIIVNDTLRKHVKAKKFGVKLP